MGSRPLAVGREASACVCVVTRLEDYVSNKGAKREQERINGNDGLDVGLLCAQPSGDPFCRYSTTQVLFRGSGLEVQVRASRQ